MTLLFRYVRADYIDEQTQDAQVAARQKKPQACTLPVHGERQKMSARREYTTPIRSPLYTHQALRVRGAARRAPPRSVSRPENYAELHFCLQPPTHLDGIGAKANADAHFAGDCAVRLAAHQHDASRIDRYRTASNVTRCRRRAAGSLFDQRAQLQRPKRPSLIWRHCCSTYWRCRLCKQQKGAEHGIVGSALGCSRDGGGGGGGTAGTAKGMACHRRRQCPAPDARSVAEGART